MKFHFSIKASFTVNNKGWCCVTKGNISFSSLLFCFGSADFGFCEFHLFLIAIFLSNCVGSLCPSSTIKRSFEFWKTFLKLSWQIGGWQGAKRKRILCLCIQRYNCQPWTVSKNIVSVNFGGEFNSRMSVIFFRVLSVVGNIFCPMPLVV